MDDDLLLSMNAPEGDALPGRRLRRERSRRRRRLRMIEPFLLLGALAVFSTGIVKVVETRVPTKAGQRDSRRIERAQEQVREEARALATTLDGRWLPALPGDEGALLGDAIAPFADPWTPVEERMQARAAEERPEEEIVDQLSMPISSTSKTSAAPPGMLGGEPLSP